MKTFRMHTKTCTPASPRAVVLGLLLLAACGGDGEKETAAAPAAADSAAPAIALGPQDIAEARRGELAAGVVLSGSLQPAEVVPIQAQVAGTMGSVRVDRGSPVRRGQVMAVIQAAGVRSQAAGARAGVAAAEANEALARQRLDAAKTLHDAGAMSEIDYRTAQSAYEAARAQVAAAGGQAASANEEAARATITAPISGVVSARDVEPGQPVRVGDPLFTVVNSAVLELSGQVPVEEAGAVTVGQPVIFTLTGRTEELRGTVARKDPVADPATRQVGVYVRLQNPGGRIVGGQFARGRVMSDSAVQATLVPEAAVRGEGDSVFVLVVEQGRVARRDVVLGPRDPAAGMVAVRSGVEPGTRVVIAPGTSITPGMAVDTSVSGTAAARSRE